MKGWQVVADNLKKAGWSWGCVSALHCEGRTIWIVGADREGKRFVVRADEKLTAFVELGKGDLRICGGFDLVTVALAQPEITKGEQFGLQTHIAATESISLCMLTISSALFLNLNVTC